MAGTGAAINRQCPLSPQERRKTGHSKIAA
jgi:hypothetical protein